MPRQVQVLRFCEIHTEVEASDSINVSINGGKPRTADYCEECSVIVIPFLRLMEAGFEEAPPKRARRPQTPVVPAPNVEKAQADLDNTECPLCDAPPYANRQSLSKHLRAVHDKGVRQLLAEGITV